MNEKKEEEQEVKKNKKKRINLIKEFSVLLKYKKRTKEVSLLSEKFIELFQSELVLLLLSIPLISASNFFQNPILPYFLSKKCGLEKQQQQKIK